MTELLGQPHERNGAARVADSAQIEADKQQTVKTGLRRQLPGRQKSFVPQKETA
jgi:hypothetical protein